MSCSLGPINSAAVSPQDPGSLRRTPPSHCICPARSVQIPTISHLRQDTNAGAPPRLYLSCISTGPSRYIFINPPQTIPSQHITFATPSYSMKFLTPLLTSLVAIAEANRCTGHKDHVGYCDTLTFEDVTASTRNPPSTAQCETTCGNILTDAGDWAISFFGKPEGWTQQLVQADCDFTVGRVSSFFLFSTVEMEMRGLGWAGLMQHRGILASTNSSWTTRISWILLMR